MALLHLEDDSATLYAVKAVRAADEKLHSRVPKILFVYVLSVDTHNVFVCLHLAKLAHEHVERVLRIDEELR